MTEENNAASTSHGMLIRAAILLAVGVGIGVAGVLSRVLTVDQAVACGVFGGIILGTLFFWNFRLAVAFIGLAVLMFNKALTIPPLYVS